MSKRELVCGFFGWLLVLGECIYLICIGASLGIVIAFGAVFTYLMTNACFHSAYLYDQERLR